MITAVPVGYKSCCVKVNMRHELPVNEGNQELQDLELLLRLIVPNEKLDLVQTMRHLRKVCMLNHLR